MLLNARCAVKNIDQMFTKNEDLKYKAIFIFHQATLSHKRCERLQLFYIYLIIFEPETMKDLDRRLNDWSHLTSAGADIAPHVMIHRDEECTL